MVEFIVVEVSHEMPGVATYLLGGALSSDASVNAPSRIDGIGTFSNLTHVWMSFSDWSATRREDA